MGIKGLTRLISDNAPEAIRYKKIGAFTGRKIAIDASMSIYQFMVRTPPTPPPPFHFPIPTHTPDTPPTNHRET